VYALARSGDVPDAKSELDRLATLGRPHPLLEQLRAYVEKGAPPGKDAGPAVTSAAVEQPAHAAVQPPAGAAPPPQAGAAAGAGADAKTLVRLGNEAYGRGDLDKAQRYYAAALDQSPGESEAHGGLGEIARAHGDLNSARRSFQNALASNRNYMPALIGLADVEWASGNRTAAQKMYKDIVDNYPEGLYPPVVKQRAEATAPAPTATAAPTPTGAATESPAPTP
jgi:tetratricopeptide (TPR) repeat protein